MSNNTGRRAQGAGRRGKKVVALLSVLCLLSSTLGCEAFVRKFTRKSKKDKAPEEMVLAPEEWKGPKMTKEEQYKQYFIFWQSWHDELLNAFAGNASPKKKLDCAGQAIKNLVGMRGLLNEDRQKQLDVYLRQFNDLKAQIKSDIYGSSKDTYNIRAENIRRNILQRFSYNDIKNDLL
ncbi:MAG: hypothetical protein Q7K98_02300 [Candidatus Omnitrophota bacterium]|nr:hypothetical protein [Candidatus Omnitrophota bacterium]